MKKKPASTPKKPTSSKPATKRQPLLIAAMDAAKKLISSRRNKKPAAPATEVDATTVVRRSYLRPKKTEVPALLLEGDEPSPVVRIKDGRSDVALFGVYDGHGEDGHLAARYARNQVNCKHTCQLNTKSLQYYSYFMITYWIFCSLTVVDQESD